MNIAVFFCTNEPYSFISTNSVGRQWSYGYCRSCQSAEKKYTRKQKTFVMSSSAGRLTCAALPKLGENVRAKKIELI